MEPLHYLLMRAHGAVNREILDGAAKLGLTPGRWSRLRRRAFLVGNILPDFNAIRGGLKRRAFNACGIGKPHCTVAYEDFRIKCNAVMPF